MTTAAPIGLVTVNYASAELLRQTPDTLSSAEVEIVVVDNFSTAAERARITRLAAERDWHLVSMPDNRGFGAGVNAGVRRARELGCRCFLLLNPDARAEPEVVASLRAASLADPMALISPRLVDRDGRLVFAGSHLDLRTGRTARARAATGPEEMFWLTAACLAVHDELWQRVGGLAEDYFMYWEDVDLNYRCHQVGARILFREDLAVLHDQGGTQGPRRGRAKSTLYYFYNARNRMLFARRHLSRRSLWGWWWRTPQVSWEILLRGGRRQLVEAPTRVAAAARGGLAGMALSLPALLGGVSATRSGSAARPVGPAAARGERP